MGVEAVRVGSVSPYGDRAYELVRGTAEFAVDPGHSANRRIVDLEFAPRGDDGLVRFDADLRILRPVGGGSGDLLVVVPNRGRLGGAPFSMGTVVDYADLERIDAGDGFLPDRGWTIVWCGWQWDVRRGPGQLGVTVPRAQVPPGWVRVEWRSDRDRKRPHLLSETMPGLGGFFRFETYPTADIGDPAAVLRVRDTPDGEWSEIPRGSWRFTDAEHIALDGGFRAFHWYELVYRTARAPIAGCGLLAVRDIVSHLRSEGVERAFGFGISQSGRFLRQFLWDGMNLDESGRQVFDGVFAHVASGARGEFNHRYAQPSLTGVDGFASLPPFDSTGLLARQRDTGGVPKVILTNSASEYWRGDGSSVHIDAETGTDVPEDPDVRVYALAAPTISARARSKTFCPGPIRPTTWIRNRCCARC
ncbi:alpha/beta hydrolase domain-containing protein [Nocardia pseudobrasiliensis]|uniref:Alpha/beta hydrolase domain-containing protein n=1 Tax=Nocardia pseudobrasiliensis TaxID=45979 RepID=A0A370I780_9NOCA|nr:alpha/beta hydrolase domain-containing protein [Nocardia pseudobrasiliensis]RDI66585.1 hypothetical protein DFR76_104335 [Nocardia pseudobrasiliensis]